MRNKNHSDAKLAEHDFLIDMRYIRRRETYYLVNKMAVPAWIRFAIWAINRGLKTQLRESLSSESKYITVTSANFGKKNIGRPYIIRFSDHKWIDKGIFSKPDFECGLKFLPLTQLIVEVDKIISENKPLIELGKPNEDGHRCELQKRQFVNENKKLRFYVFCPICNKRSDFVSQEHIAKKSWDEGARFPLDNSCTPK